MKKLLGLWLLLALNVWAVEVGVRWQPSGYAFLPGETLEFQAANLQFGETLTFQWDFGDGTTASGESVSHAFAQPGRYKVVTIATGEDGTQHPPVVNYLFINASTGPHPSDWGGYIVGDIVETDDFPRVVKAGDTVRYEARAQPSAENLFWQIGRTDQTHVGPTFDWTVPADWDNTLTTVRLFLVHPDGTANPWPDQKSVYVYAETPPPDVSLTQPAPEEDGVYRMDLGQSLTFQGASDNPTDTLQWEIQCRGELDRQRCNDWDIPDGGPFNGETFTFQPSEPGYYLLVLNAVDENGVSDPFPQNLEVLVRGENRPPEGTILTPSQTLGINETLELQGSGSDADGDLITHLWDLGDGRTATGETLQISYTQAGAYLVQLTATDSFGAEDPSPYGIWVLVNDASVAPFNQEALAAVHAPQLYDSFPVGEPVTFNGYLSDADSADLTGYWDLGDGNPVSGSLEFDRAFSETGARTATLFVRDGDGWSSQRSARTLFNIHEGTTPPVAVITGPVQRESPVGELRHTIRAGEAVAFEGTVAGVADLSQYTATWSIYEEPFTRVLTGFAPEPAVFDTPGAFYVGFQVLDPNGVRNPFQAEILIVVLDDLPPEAAIIEPGYNRSIKVSDGISLAAQACDPEGGALSYLWTLSDGRTFTDERVEWVTFTEPGLYRISLSVTDEQGHTVSPDPSTLIVLPDSARNIWVGPTVRPLAPLQDTLGGPAGSAFNFAVEPADVAGIPFTDFFWDFGDGRTARSSAPGRMVYEQPGYYPVAAYVRDPDGFWSTSPYRWTVVINGDNTPPTSTILQPERRDSPYERRARTIPILMGTTLELSGTAEDVDGNYPILLEWRLNYQDYHIGPDPPPLHFEEVGSHVLSLRGIDAAGAADPVGDERFIRVVDPNLKPESYIETPVNEITVEPGTPLVFDGYGVDPNRLEMTYEWQFGGDAVPASATTSKVYPVVYTQETPPDQPHEVRFWVRTEFTEDATPAIVRVHVRQYEDADFEPNDQLTDAKALGQGEYSRFNLGEEDTGDFFAFDLEQPDLDLQFSLSTLERLLVTVYRQTGDHLEAVETDLSLEAGTLTLQNPGVGRYICHITASDTAKRNGLSYAFGIRTLQPALYLPFLTDDGSLRSHLGLVNPLNQTTDLVIQGINESGDTIESVPYTLAANQRLYSPVIDFFNSRGETGQSRHIRWVKVLSTTRLVGFTNAETYDQSQLMSSGAAYSLSDAVLVPHVATAVQTWYTRAVLVNGSETEKTVDLETPLENWSPGKAEANSQIDFRFEDIFSSLPPWGRFKDRAGGAGLAGFEIFGRSDGFKQTAALEMIPTLTQNPNFNYVGRNIYFTHVADPNLFWTGVALINPEPHQATYNMVGYNADGAQIIRQDNRILEAGGKLLSTTQDLFGEAAVAWIAVESESRLAGFELFGDYEGRLLAGFPAATYAANQLLFPHVDIADGDSWTGIAVLNVSTQPVEIIAKAYDEAGVPLSEITLTLPPQTKLVRTPQALFPTPVPTAAYITVTADTSSLAGFELFGTLNEDGTLGEQMAGLPAQTGFK